MLSMSASLSVEMPKRNAHILPSPPKRQSQCLLIPAILNTNNPGLVRSDDACTREEQENVPTTPFGGGKGPEDEGDGD